MTDSIPANKSKSKVKPLQDKIQSLTFEIESMLEEMYKAGLRTRPTIMSKIEEKEAETKATIKYLIKDCEKTTGREFRWFKANNNWSTK